MRIDWGVTKPQGNVRPVFWYELSLSEEEEKLHPQIAPLETKIPVPLAMFVNGGKDQEPLPGMLRPSHLDRRTDHLPTLVVYGDRGKRWVVLPWREDGYWYEREIRTAVESFRARVEEALRRACDSKAFDVSESLEMSESTRRHIAPFIARKKMFE
ncbi:MAG: hypothetical protein ACLFQR_12490 [Desulfovibrionales bacterium]